MRTLCLAVGLVCLGTASVPAQSQPGPATRAGSARDPDQRFLREMIDHHEGLIYLVHEAMGRSISKEAHDVLDGFDVTEDAEKREMTEFLRSFFRDAYQGTPTKQDKSAADSVLRQSSSAAFDRVASAFVVNHHRRGIRLIRCCSSTYKTTASA